MRRISYANAYALSAYDIVVEQSDDVKPMWYKCVSDTEGILVGICEDDDKEYIDAPTVYDTLEMLKREFDVHVAANASGFMKGYDGRLVVEYLPMIMEDCIMTTLTSRECDDFEDALEAGITAAIESITLER